MLKYYIYYTYHAIIYLHTWNIITCIHTIHIISVLHNPSNIPGPSSLALTPNTLPFCSRTAWRTCIVIRILINHGTCGSWQKFMVGLTLSALSATSPSTTSNGSSILMYCRITFTISSNAAMILQDRNKFLFIYFFYICQASILTQYNVLSISRLPSKESAWEWGYFLVHILVKSQLHVCDAS